MQGQNLNDFVEDIQKYKVIVSYNGRSFDVPFIENYFKIRLNHAHIDLRYILYSLGFKGGLKGCERQLDMDRGDLRDIEFDNEHLDRADNALVKKGQFYNGVDFSRLLGLNKLMNNLLSKKKTTLPVWQDQKESDILAKYSVQFMSENYNIPWHQVDEFLIYLESKESSNKISSIQSEVQLLEFLLKESKVFLQKVNEN